MWNLDVTVVVFLTSSDVSYKFNVSYASCFTAVAPTTPKTAVPFLMYVVFESSISES